MLAQQRKFMKGLLFGLLAGFAIGAALNDKQRKQLVSEVKKTAAPLGRSIASNVSQVAETVVDEASSKVDDVGDAAAAKISSDDTPAESADALINGTPASN